MALLFYGKIFGAPLSTASTTIVYSRADWNERIAVAEKFSAELRGTQSVGSATPSVSADIQTSNDGNFWTTYGTVIASTPLTPKSTNLAWGQTIGAFTLVGKFARMRITMTAAAACSAYVELWLVGRSND